MKYHVRIVINGVEQQGKGQEIPVGFGDEYKIRIYGSQDGLRAVARVWIDGVLVTGEGGLVVPAYASVDLETPVADPGHRFRFASTESAAADAAGKAGPDLDGTKGLIKVEVFAEKRTSLITKRYLYGPLPQYRWTGDAGRESLKQCSPHETFTADCCHVSGSSYSPGVTVEGSASDQTFRTIQMEYDEHDSEVFTLKLVGFVRRPVAPPSLHSPMPATGFNYCPGCGTRLPSLSNRCPGCQRVCR